MIHRIRTYFNRKPSTDKALRGISIALDELQEVIDHEEEEICRLDAVIDETAEARLEAFKRRDRAELVSQRFADLIA